MDKNEKIKIVRGWPLSGEGVFWSLFKMVYRGPDAAADSERCRLASETDGKQTTHTFTLRF